MENPDTWGEPEKVIDEALRKAHEGHLAGVIGWSAAKQIAEALRAAGLLKEPKGDPTCVVCNKQVPLRHGVLAEHPADTPGALPGMPCPGSGTWDYILANCVCGRTIDECRCGAAERA